MEEKKNVSEDVKRTQRIRDHRVKNGQPKHWKKWMILSNPREFISASNYV